MLALLYFAGVIALGAGIAAYDLWRVRRRGDMADHPVWAELGRRLDT